MKVPFSANNQSDQTVSSKPSNCTVNTTPNTNLQDVTTPTSSPYEPKSVLEIQGSPSPVADKKPASDTDNSIVLDDPFQLEDHVLSHQFDDLDSFMREFGLNDDSSPVSKPIYQHSINGEPQTLTQYPSLQEFPPISLFDSTQFVPSDFGLFSDISTYNTASLSHNTNIVNTFDVSTDIQSFNNNDWNVGFNYVNDLIRLAECFDTNSLQIGQTILARLNQTLRSPIGKPPQRAAFYFKEALQSLFTGLTQTTHPASTSEIIQTIKAQKTFSSISPIPMFSSFTANQALLEATDGCTHVQVIDFDIGLGGQWASFMKELASKADSRKMTPPVLRITAIVPEDYATESRLITENLTQFARELNIKFDIDFVSIRSFGYLSFRAIKFMDGEKIAVLLSPAIFQQIGTGFLNDLRHVPPHVVVHVHSEGQMGFGTSSYRQTVIGGLEFYTGLLESLETANVNDDGSDWMRRIETFVFFPKILKAMEAAGHQGPPWREALVAVGLRQVGPSHFSYLQAECLLRRMQVRGFHVAKHQEEMLLYWHDRLLFATSAWKY
ncbi:scarecrow 15 [Olea europaea subsp. europaea]|uniref:Scarecrow 15 n=1 Tax=Olea europaea subsp. europaea TaxID=158383 RepID=A0A8S0S2A2_OLEEU|nr:scarecrow 15 [Olea europaea subsp. europaea]